MVVPEPTIEETFEILQGLRERYEVSSCVNGVGLLTAECRGALDRKPSIKMSGVVLHLPLQMHMTSCLWREGWLTVFFKFFVSTCRCTTSCATPMRP